MKAETLFEDNKLYTIKQVADILCVSKFTVYGWLRAKKLKALRIGERHLCRIFGRDLNAFVFGTKVKA